MVPLLVAKPGRVSCPTYLNGYVPRLQSEGGVVAFLREAGGHVVPSPAIFGEITKSFGARLRAGCQNGRFPGSSFGRESARTTSWSSTGNAFPSRRGWGPAFLKICGDAPYGLKLCLNGHEWAKRQLQQRRWRFTALDNGVPTCATPMALQAVCDQLGEADIAAFFTRWLAQVPLPLTPEQRASFPYQLSILQMEVSRTQVLDQPRRGREFFEEILRDHLDLGRPSRRQVLFPRKITRATPGRFSTRVVTQGVLPSRHVEYKRCHIKQYFEEGRALCTGKRPVNHVVDVGPHRLGGRLVNLPTRAVTGARWSGREMCWRHAPREYAAIHFHDDDLHDAGRATDFEFAVPDDLPGGAYVMRLAAGGHADEVPFYVRPPRGRPRADVLFVAPTYTYQAYANHARGSADAAFRARMADWGAYPHNADDHPEYGRSTYNRHATAAASATPRACARCSRSGRAT